MDKEPAKREQAAPGPEAQAGAAPAKAPAAPRPGPAQPPAPKRRAQAKARPELEREVTSRLSFLRQAARESGHNYVVNLEHDLIRLTEAVREMFRAKSGPGKKEMGRLDRALAIADRTKLKPAKGRRKDLKRIEEAVASMEKLLVKKK